MYCALLCVQGNDFAIFVPSVRRILVRHRLSHPRLEAIASRILKRDSLLDLPPFLRVYAPGTPLGPGGTPGAYHHGSASASRGHGPHSTAGLPDRLFSLSSLAGVGPGGAAGGGGAGGAGGQAGYPHGAPGAAGGGNNAPGAYAGAGNAWGGQHGAGAGAGGVGTGAVGGPLGPSAGMVSGPSGLMLEEEWELDAGSLDMSAGPNNGRLMLKVRRWYTGSVVWLGLSEGHAAERPESRRGTSTLVLFAEGPLSDVAGHVLVLR